VVAGSVFSTIFALQRKKGSRMSGFYAEFCKFALSFIRVADIFKEAYNAYFLIDESRQLIRTNSEIRRKRSPQVMDVPNKYIPPKGRGPFSYQDLGQSRAYQQDKWVDSRLFVIRQI
jgi:hypothetical protein